MCFYPLKTFLNLLKLYPIAVGVSKREFAPLVVQEGSETQSKGFPTVLSPISVRTEIGCPHGMSAFIPIVFSQTRQARRRLKIQL